LFVILTGYLFIISNNIDRHSVALKQKIELAVFVKQTEKSCEVIEEKIRALDNVKSVKFISKSHIKEKLVRFKNEINITGVNPFPDTFSVIPKEYDGTKIELMATQIKSMGSVSDVRYDRNIVSVVDGLKKFARFSRTVFRLALIILFMGIIITVIVFVKHGEKILLNRYIDLIVGFIGIISGIICLKLLSLILSSVPANFISLGQMVLLFVTGISVDIIYSLNDANVNE
jgi:hypothetical protein